MKNFSRGQLFNRVIECTAKACGVALHTVYNIQSEFNDSGGILRTSEKRYAKSRIQIQLDDFKFEAIRRIVHEFYTRRKYLTLQSLLAFLKTRDIFLVVRKHCLVMRDGGM